MAEEPVNISEWQYRQFKEKQNAMSKETVNHPYHYNALPAVCKNCGQQIECIDVIRHMDFSTGNIVKYLWRKDHKGNVLEDLKKAKFYLDNLIEWMEKNFSER